MHLCKPYLYKTSLYGIETVSLAAFDSDALTLRWPCPKQNKTMAVAAGV